MGRPESPLDPSAGPVQRLAAELRKLRVEAGSPTYREMAARSGCGASTLSQAAGGERLPSLATVLAFVAACGADPGTWRDRHREAADETADLRRAAETGGGPPYRGLARYEPADRHLFFGRDELVGRAVELVGRRRVSVVVGASGAGKSSLLRAGLIPVLQRGAAGRAPLAAVRIITPGGLPVRRHADRFSPAPGAGETVVVVDQFEEVFTLCQDPAEREAFIRLLLTALDEDSRLRVVIGIRADFYGRCAEHPGLAAAVQDAGLLVGPMTPAELREAVVRPAAAAGLIVERALTARIIAEVGQEPGSLPLMSHALLETWRRRRGRALTEEMYAAAGGIRGAIAATAETLHTRLSAPEAAAARRILLRLVTPGEGAQDTRRPTDRAELGAASPEAGRVLEALLASRLLTSDGDTVDLAHEALIPAWPRYRSWIDQDRERLRLHRRLTDAARTWDELDRDPGALYRGTRLTQTGGVFRGDGRDALNSLEATFLDASAAAHVRETRAAGRAARRLRTLTGALSLLLVLAFITGAAAWRQSRSGDRARARAVAARQTALSRRLAAESATLLGTDTDLGTLLAAQAYTVSPTREATAGLYRAAAVPLLRHLTGPAGPVVGVTFSHDGRTMAWGTRDGTVTETGSSGRRPPTARALRLPSMDSLAFGPDDRTLVASDTTGDVRLLGPDGVRSRIAVPGGRNPTSQWLATDGATFVGADSTPRGAVTITDVGSGRSRTVDLRAGHGLRAGGRIAGLSADRRVLATTADSTLTLWDTATGRARVTRTLPFAHAPLAFSPDGRVAATVGVGGTVQLWDTATGRTSCTFSTGTQLVDPITSLVFSPDGRTLAAGGTNGTVWLWDSGTGQTRAVLNGYAGAVGSLAFSPDGRLLASGLQDGSVRLWNTAADLSRVLSPAGGPGPARHTAVRGAHVSFRSHGRVLAVDHANGPARLVDTATGRIRTVPALPGPGTDPATGPDAGGRARLPDGRTLTVVTGRTRVEIRDTATGELLHALDTALPVMALAVSPDGRTLATSSDDGTVQLRDISTGMVRETLTTTSPAVSVAFSPDGRTLATGSDDGTAAIWSLALPDPAAAVRQICTAVGRGLTPQETAEYLPHGVSRPVCTSRQ